MGRGEGGGGMMGRGARPTPILKQDYMYFSNNINVASRGM
jgi:hypothetical protein